MRSDPLFQRAQTLVALVGALMLLASSAWADHVAPSFEPGNPTCSDLVGDPDTKEFKIQPVEDGTYTDGVTGFSVTIDVYTTGNGAEFDFSDASIAVDAVFVKGGPNGNLYEYDPPVTADTGLHAPLNDSNGKWYGLSHISFCWVERPSTALSLDAADPGLTIHKGDDVTLTFAEANDGNIPLSGATVSANNGCAPAYVSGDDGDGVLEPGEIWLFECTITNVQGDVVITAIGSGTTPEGDNVTWCPDPGSPPANTICDQDERAQVPIDVINPSTDLSLSAADPGTTILKGSDLTLTFEEANDGDVPLTSASVSANNGCAPAYVSGDDGDGVLEPGETWVFECTITNVQADVTITAIGTGTDPLGFAVTWCADPGNPPASTICDEDERVQVPIDVINPSTDLSLSAADPGTTIHKGDDVTITFAEHNDGDVDLTDAAVSADNGCTPAYASGDDGDGVLEPGETWVFECTITNVQADVTITAIGTGTDPLGNTITWCEDPGNPPAGTVCDQDERTQVSITVITSSTDLSLSNVDPGQTIVKGGSVTLTFAETNDGSADLTGASVSANNGCAPAYVSGDDGDGVLEPGETWLFECTITNVQADVTITAIGTGTDPLGFTVTWCADPANPPANTICDQDERIQVAIDVINPSTVLTLSGANPGTQVQPGADVTLIFAEHNDGDVDLTDAAVSADNGCTPAYASGDDGDGVLEPGETWLFECTITNVQADVTITAIGTGTDPLGNTITWCEDPGNPPAGTVCDQDEIALVLIDVAFEGCTPGYWKTHPDAWGPTGFTTGQTLESVFDVPDVYGFDDDTLLEALNYPGGNGKKGAAMILLRTAVAALLNAGHPDVEYPMTEADIIADVNAALASGRGAMLTLASQLDAANNEGCPLN